MVSFADVASAKMEPTTPIVWSQNYRILSLTNFSFSRIQCVYIDIEEQEEWNGETYGVLVASNAQPHGVSAKIGQTGAIT